MRVPASPAVSKYCTLTVTCYYAFYILPKLLIYSHLFIIYIYFRTLLDSRLNVVLYTLLPNPNKMN